jgi:hypothetical protein
MNTAAAKTLVWTAAAVFGAGLVAHVAWFLTNDADAASAPTRESMEKQLSEVREIPQRVQDVVDYNLVKRGVGREFDWSGKPPPPPAPKVEPQPEGAQKVRDPIEKYLIVRAVKVDAVSPDMSDAFLKYKSEANVPPNVAKVDGTVLKRVGERLDGTILSQIKVVAIRPDGVLFSFINDPQREHELVAPQEYSLGARYRVLDNGQTLPDPVSDVTQIPRRTDNTPLERTTPISPNRFRIGTEDAREIDERYAEIITEEVGYRRFRDPVTRQPAGIEITSVKPGSLAARHGVQQGDVIKSINGHPVSSESEAIQYVKQNKDNYDEWVVEVWNRGQTRTVTYYSPNN